MKRLHNKKQNNNLKHEVEEKLNNPVYKHAQKVISESNKTMGEIKEYKESISNKLLEQKNMALD